MKSEGIIYIYILLYCELARLFVHPLCIPLARLDPLEDAKAVVDGNVITSQGPGTSCHGLWEILWESRWFIGLTHDILQKPLHMFVKNDVLDLMPMFFHVFFLGFGVYTLYMHT